MCGGWKRRPLASLPPLPPHPSVAHKFPKIPVTPSSLGPESKCVRQSMRRHPRVCVRRKIQSLSVCVRQGNFHDKDAVCLGFQDPLFVWLRVKGWGLSDWPVSAVRGPPGKKRDSTSWQSSHATASSHFCSWLASGSIFPIRFLWALVQTRSEMNHFWFKAKKVHVMYFIFYSLNQSIFSYLCFSI